MHTIPGSALTALYKKVHTSTSLFKWALLLHTKDHNLFFHCHKAVAHILGPITTFQSLFFPVTELLVPWYQSQTLHAALQPICVTLTLNVTPFFLQDTSVLFGLENGSQLWVISKHHYCISFCAPRSSTKILSYISPSPCLMKSINNFPAAIISPFHAISWYRPLTRLCFL